MDSRKGQFRTTMKKRFGPVKAGKAERCVKSLKGKYGSDARAPYAICTASIAGTRKDRGR